MKSSLYSLFCVLATVSTVFGSDALSRQKLKMSFYVLNENFSLNNRNRENLTRNQQLLPLAESTVTSFSNFYPYDIEFTLDAIRTLYVEGNYYLRIEKFSLAQKKLSKAKALCEQYLQDMPLTERGCKLSPEISQDDYLQICNRLAEIDLKLPALYSLVLHHLGQIPIYYKDSSLSLTDGEQYLTLALSIREIIDQYPNQFLNVSDNNREIGDQVIFKRVLSFVYFETDQLEKAEEMCLSLLSQKDAYNQLLTLKQLLKIYLRKVKLVKGDEKRKYYKKAENCVKKCLDILVSEQEMKMHTRISSIYLAIGQFYADEHNPFQNLEESHRILQMGKLDCPKQLEVTLGRVKEELGSALDKLSKRELEEAISLKWNFTETEHTTSLKHLENRETHIVNYDKLGDLFFEQKKFVQASAFYSNGLSLVLKNSDNRNRKSEFYRKLALVEERVSGRQEQVENGSYERLIESYKTDLEQLRLTAKKKLQDEVEIENIYSFVFESYKTLLQRIFKDLLDDLGKPPCEEYAIIAFGSIGRGCVTPYSDIEYTILIKDELNRPYFKTLSELFCIRVNALAESPIAGFGIESMNWLTRDQGPSDKGFRLDPVYQYAILPHIPLAGRFELITTPEKLAGIMESGIDFPLYVKTLFYTHTIILGKESLINAYQQEIDRILDLPRAELVKQLIVNDLENYYIHFGNWLNDKDKYSIKYDFYRPLTVLLDALAIKEGIRAPSPWVLIDTLAQKGVIDEELRNVLRFSFDELARIQLSCYLDYGKHNIVIYSQDTGSIETKKYQNEERLFKLFQTIIDFQNKIKKLIS